MCIHHLFRNKPDSWRSEKGVERGRVMPLCKWNVRVTEGLCASETVGPRQSQRGEWGAGLPHRLNRLGATAACLREWGSAFWADGGMSLRAPEWVRGPVSARLCAAFVAPDEEGQFLFRIFGARSRKHAHTNELGWYFSLKKSCVLMQLHPGWVSTGWHLSQFMGVCLFSCLCVSKVGCIVWARCWRASHCWLVVYILGPLIVIETSGPLVVFESQNCWHVFTLHTQSGNNIWWLFTAWNVL